MPEVMGGSVRDTLVIGQPGRRTWRPVGKELAFPGGGIVGDRHGMDVYAAQRCAIERRVIWGCEADPGQQTGAPAAEIRHAGGTVVDHQPGALAAANIGYAHAPGLGGFRRPTPDSLNAGWRNLSFRGYADYMQTDEFAQELAGLIELARTERLALMCAEAVPWRCHRSLIADALTVHGVATCELVSATRLQPHRLTPFAQVDGLAIRYPPEPEAPKAHAPEDRAP
jgi:hypothetical protein